MSAERVFYLVRLHTPEEAQKADIEHIKCLHEAIMEAGGFSTELEEIMDIVDARKISGS